MFSKPEIVNTVCQVIRDNNMAITNDSMIVVYNNGTPESTVVMATAAGTEAFLQAFDQIVPEVTEDTPSELITEFTKELSDLSVSNDSGRCVALATLLAEVITREEQIERPVVIGIEMSGDEFNLYSLSKAAILDALLVTDPDRVAKRAEHLDAFVKENIQFEDHEFLKIIGTDINDPEQKVMFFSNDVNTFMDTSAESDVLDLLDSLDLDSETIVTNRDVCEVLLSIVNTPKMEQFYMFYRHRRTNGLDVSSLVNVFVLVSLNGYISAAIADQNQLIADVLLTDENITVNVFSNEEES